MSTTGTKKDELASKPWSWPKEIYEYNISHLMLLLVIFFFHKKGPASMIITAVYVFGSWENYVLHIFPDNYVVITSIKNRTQDVQCGILA